MARQRVPKPPKPPKVPRPKTSELAKLYKGLLTVDWAARMAALGSALHWYDKAREYVALRNQGQLSTAQLKEFDRGDKCRNLGINRAATNAERENAYGKALLNYEKACVELKPPTIAGFLQQLSLNEATIRAKEEKLASKYTQIFELLSNVLKPTNYKGKPVTLKVGPVLDAYKIDPELSHLAFRRDFARDLLLAYKRQGVLTLVRLAIEPLSKTAAVEPQVDTAGHQTGQWVVSRQKQLQASARLWESFDLWAHTPDAPKRLVRRFGVHTQAAATGAPKAKREWKGGGPLRGPKVDGVFVEGSAVAWLYTTLSDGKLHNKAELQKHITANLRDRLSKITFVGKSQINSKGQHFWIEEHGDDCKMVFDKAVAS